jgi:hypothetical protein
MFPNIEKLLQLHQEVSIIYVVYGYEAIFFRDENYTVLAKGVGKTIKEAMEDLEIACEQLDFQRDIKKEK